MDGGAWQAAVHGVAKSQARLSNFTLTFHFHALEKEMATHSSILAWRIPGTEEPSGLPSMGSHRVRHDWSNLAAAAAAYSVTECVHCLVCETVMTQMTTSCTYYWKTPSPPSALAHRGLASMGQVRWLVSCHKQALAGLTVDSTSCLSGQPILLCIPLINSSSIMSFAISTHMLISSFYRINSETLIYTEKEIHL